MRRLNGTKRAPARRHRDQHGFGPNLEAVERRELLSTITFNPDPLQAGAPANQQYSITSLNFGSGNALGQASISNVTGSLLAPGSTFQLTYQTTLVALNNAFGPITVPGLNGTVGTANTFQITEVANFTEEVMSLTAGSATAIIDLAPTQAAGSGIAIYYNDLSSAGASKANNAAGTGFAVGNVILTASLTADNSNYTDLSKLTSTAPVPLNQSGAGDYATQTTDQGTGSTTLSANVNFSDPRFFQTAPQIIATTFSSNLVNPFRDIPPSDQFTNISVGVGSATVGTPIIPSLGANNGTGNGPGGTGTSDFILEVSAATEAFITGTLTNPQINIVKLTNGTNNDSPPVPGVPDGPIVPVGSTVTWTYNVTDPGNEPIANVNVTDNIAGVNPTPVLSGGFNVGDSNDNGLLDPGETWVFTASGTAIAGQYSNVGTVTGTSTISNTPVTASNPDHYFGETPVIQIVKLTNGTNNDSPPVAGTPDGPIVPVGSTVTWTYNVTDTGSNVPLSNVTVADNIAGVNPTPVLSGGFNVGDTNHDNLLEPGETWVFTASGTAVAGQYSNIGTATGTPPTGPNVTATNPDHYFGETPVIQIVKLTNGTNNDSPPVAGTPDGPIVPVGSTVTWTYNVTDTGSNVPLSNVTVADNIAGVNPTAVLSGGFNVGDTNHDNLLEPGETWVFTASGTAVAGQYSNIGTATGTPPTGPNVTATNPDHYFGETPVIQIVKLTNGTNNDSPPVAGTPDGPIVPVGSTVTWTYNVTDTGSNVPLSNVTVADNIAGVNPTAVLSGGFNVGDTNHDNLLEPGETWVFTASGTAVAGQYSNIGTATGTPPTGPNVTATNPDHYFGETPVIQIVKLTNGTNNDSPPVAGTPDGPIVPVGSTVTWTYNVTDTGSNVPLSNVTVADNIAGVNPTAVLSGGFNVGDTNHDNLLEPGETWVFTASGTAVAGQYSNIGTATGTPPTGPNVTATNPDHYFGETPVIQIVKLTNGTNNDSPPVAGTPDGPIVPVGSTVTWTYNVTDTGSNVPLSNVTVADNIAGVNPTAVLSGGFNVGDTNHDNLLEPGETWVFTASGTAVAGQYSNIGTATGTPPTGPNVTATNPDHYFGETPVIQIVKLTNGTNNDSPPVAGTPDGPIVPVGSTVTWTYNVTDTGSNVPLSNVTVADNIAGVNPTAVLSGGFNVGDTNHDNLLEPGETWVFTASGTAVAGQYSNIGTATGTPPTGPNVTATNPDHYFGETPVIQIVKLTNGTNNDSPPVAGTPDGPIVPVGSTVTWTYNVTDTGSNVPLSNVTVADNIAGVNPTAVLSGGFNVGDTNHDNLLEPGETWVFTASGTAVAGQYSNIGTATGTPPTGPNVTATNPDHYFGETPVIQIVKLTNGTNNDSPPVAGTPDGPIVPVGSTVTWTYNVTDTGSNVPLSNVTVADNIAGVNPTAVLSGGFNVGDTNHDNLLEPGETWVFTASGTAIAGQYSNIGTATGTPPTGPNVTATNPDHYFGETPVIQIVKLTNGTNNDSPPVAGTPDGPIVPVGSTVTWTYNVTDTGSNVPLSNVTVADNIAGVNPTPVLSGGFNVGDTNHDNLLEPGETWVFTASGTAIAGQYSNIGTATGTPPTGPNVTATNPDHYFGQTSGTPNLGITKTADQSTILAGTTAGFTVTITNTGTATDTNVTLTDPLPAGTGGDINWSIDTTTGNPTDFTITGSQGSQSLGLSPSFIAGGDSLAPGQSILVHITSPTNVGDASGSLNPALGVLGQYAVLFDSGSGNQLSIANDTVSGNIGVYGPGSVQFSGPGTINGRVDFSAGNTGQFHNTNGSNVGPTSVNYNVAAVTTARNLEISLSSGLGGLAGTNLAIGSASQTVNESAGSLQTYNGVSYRVFNVTSYAMTANNNLTIVGDGSGDPVLFNVAYNSNSNINGGVILAGSGLSDDLVMWNFTSSGKNIQMAANKGTFVGVMLLPNDAFTGSSVNIDGRIYGGAGGNMQIVSGTNVFAPIGATLPNTATTSATGVPPQSASATITLSTVAPTSNIVVTKTADSASIVAGQAAGYTVTITNTGTATATGVSLSDPLPAGIGGDVNWTIDTTKGNPADFTVTGSQGSQSLGLSPSFIAAGDSLAPGQSILVHITSPTDAADVSASGGTPVSNGSNFNGTGIAFNPVSGQNNYIWFNSVVNVSGVSQTQPTTVNITNQTVAFSYVDPVTHATVNDNLPVPNTVITFTPGLTTATLTFNTTTNSWVENLPTSGLSGNVFAGGLAFKVPADGLPGGINPVTWNGSFSSSTTGLGVQWQWAAAVYNSFTSTYNSLEVKPVDANNIPYSDNGVSGPENSDHAGTPENFTIPGILPGGARGGGGSNWTGSYSGTINVTPTPSTGSLVNMATVSATGDTGQTGETASATITITAAPQLATGSASTAGAGLTELLDPAGSLQAGQISFAVNLPQGEQASAVQAAITNAVSTLDAEVAPLGLSLVQVTGADASSAQVQISFAPTTAIGGVNQGVMGAYTTGQITLVNNWNWYYGSNAKGIAPDQYDFQSVVTHELGHVLGLGENSDLSSVMSMYLSPGEARRDLTANDLGAIQEELQGSQAPLPASSPALTSDDTVAVATASPGPVTVAASGPAAPVLAGLAATDPEGFSNVASPTTSPFQVFVVPGMEPLGDGEAAASADTVAVATASASAVTVAASGPAASVLAGPAVIVSQGLGATANPTTFAPWPSIVPGLESVGDAGLTDWLHDFAPTAPNRVPFGSFASNSLRINLADRVSHAGSDDRLGDNNAPTSAAPTVAPLTSITLPTWLSTPGRTDLVPDAVDAVIDQEGSIRGVALEVEDEQGVSAETNTMAVVLSVASLAWHVRSHHGRQDNDRERRHRRQDPQYRFPGLGRGMNHAGDRN